MKKREWIKKLLSMVLCAVMLLGMVPVGQIGAAGTPLDVVEGSKVSDPATVDHWKAYFPVSGNITTANAGGVWSDKSVFTSAADYLTATDEAENFALSLKDAEHNFLVSLSTMASTKAIKGYSSIPTDTMLVLDMSSSMRGSIDDLASAANNAIIKLFGVNKNNRVGVVLYSAGGETTVLMPLDRYTTTSGSYLEYMRTDGIKFSSGVKNSSGVTMTASDYYNSGTFTQDGVYVAMKQLLAADKTVDGGIQDGEERMPIMVLMTDGAPTILSNNFTGSFAADTRLNANTGITEHTNRDFSTQLTAAYAKYMLENSDQRYLEHDLLFYSLGFNVTVKDAPALWPQGSTETNSLWTTFLRDRKVSDRNGLNVDATGNGYDAFVRALTDSNNLRSNGYNKYRYYVDQYFSAGSASSLEAAFQAIVNEIILQSLYYPTFVSDGATHDTDGHLEITDIIGDYMEVKDIKGIQLGEHLSTGASFAYALASGQMGTKENPTDYGDDFIWSVEERLNITDKDTAWDLVRHAWDARQLYYSNDTSFSNYIGWYGSMVDGKMVYQKWWDGDLDTASTANGEYAIKSYGFQGDITEGLRSTDMYYVSVRVVTHIQSGKTEVHFDVPASLIPLVEYEVELPGEDLSSNPTAITVGGADAPIRLLFEVGLKDTINSINVASMAPGADPDKDGVYTFYTNHWVSGEDDATHIPDLSENTSVWFEASHENERYYYHEDTSVYTDTDGSYYTIRYVYSSENGVLTTAPVKEAVPAVAQAAIVNGVIPKGTPRMDHARGAEEKSENRTGTHGHYEHPMVMQNPYHLAAVLGNNGKLSINAAQGIKITKHTDQADGRDLPFNQVYTFIIANVGPNQTYQTYLEANGQIGAAVPVSSDDSGNLTVQLKKNETIYVVGMPEGTYTVTEQTDGQEFVVTAFVVDGTASSNGSAVEVENDTLTSVDVTNAPISYGDVVISKIVDSDYTDHLTPAFLYRLKVSVTGAKATADYATEIIRADGSTVAGLGFRTDDDGSANFTIDLAHGEAVPAKKLPDGAVVKVEEIAIIYNGTAIDLNGSGFTVSKPERVIAGSGKSMYFDLTNTYDPADTPAPNNVTLQIKKILDGIEYWHGGTFEFILEQHQVAADGSISHVKVGNSVFISYTGSETTDEKLSDVLTLASFGVTGYSEPGIYSYRISEVSGTENGMLYDQAYAYFDVHVEDNGLGELVIVDVTAGTDAVVAPTYDTVDTTREVAWHVEADFFNSYSVSGAASMLLNIQKRVKTDSNVQYSPAGFEFALYRANYDNGVFEAYGTAVASGVSNDAGVATLRQTFTATDLSDLPTTLYYVLKEVKPVDAVDGEPISYDTVEYGVVVELSNENGNLKIVTTVYGGGSIVDTDNDAVQGTDVAYSYDAADGITLSPATEGAVIKYRLAGSDAVYTYSAPFTVNAGTMIYAWTEVTHDDGTVQTSDEVAAYFDGSQLTTSAVVRTTLDVSFVNTYTPDPVSVVLGGAKVLNGRDLAAGEFSFALYSADSNFTITDENPLDTASNGEDTAKSVDYFSFDSIQYTKAGSYYYVIREQKGNLGGIAYDENELHVTVVVTANEAMDTLVVASVSVTNADGHNVPLAFNNTYTAAPTELEIPVEKTLWYLNEQRNIDFSEGIFSFELYETGSDYVIADRAQPLEVMPASATDANGVAKAIFKLTYDTADAGTHYYVIKEVLPTEDGSYNGAQYDTAAHKVEVLVADNGIGKMTATIVAINDVAVGVLQVQNTYKAESASVTIEGTKTLVDDAFADGQSEAFTFHLYQTGADYVVAENQQPLETATVNVNAADTAIAFAFDAIGYDKAGTFYYVVKEVEGDDPLMDYDSTVYQIKLEVHDNGQGQLKVTKTVEIENLGAAEAIAFSNERIRPEALVLALDVSKTVEGAAHSKAGFRFELKETTGTYQSEGEEVSYTKIITSDEEGNVAFSDLIFTEADMGKTYTFTVTELDDGEEGMTYSDVVHTFQVAITFDADSENLVAAVTASNGITVTEKSEEEPDAADQTLEMTFVNRYYPDLEVGIDVTKKVEGKSLWKLSPKGFQFLLIQYTDDTYTTAVSSETVTSGENGSAVFAAIQFSAEDVGKTYYYTITEIKGNKSNMDYDETVYYVTITVAEDPTSGLKAIITSDPAGTIVGNHLNVTFVNKYQDTPWWPIIPDPDPEEPDDPTDPQDPEDSVKPEVPKAPDTGDHSSPMLWWSLITISILGFVTTVICAIRRRRYVR